MRSLREAVTEREIRVMVETFYGRVQADPVLGPVFERRLSGPWPEHLDRMVDFWTSVLLGVARFQGNPREKHRAIPELRPEHFDRWLALFADVLEEIFPEHVAQDILWRARRMRQVLDAGPSPDAPHHQHVLPTTRATR